MKKDNETVKKEIEEFKSNNGKTYGDFYIGITKHIEQHIVEDNETIMEHKRNGIYTEGNPIYINECNNRKQAVEIERYFQGKGMLKFNPRSFGVEDSKFIYCFKLTEENKKMILNENSEAGKEMITKIKKFKEFKEEINGK